jgi:DNA-binding NarL/FixJ family response regulator
MISRPRVLLAEDHARVAEVLKSILEDEFDVVGAVADGLELLDAADTLRPDVIVADMSMPRLDGLSALLKLKEQQSDVKVVLITMYDEPSIARIALDSGALGFVMKHSAATDLVPAVRAAIDGKTYLSPILVEKG